MPADMRLLSPAWYAKVLCLRVYMFTYHDDHGAAHRADACVYAALLAVATDAHACCAHIEFRAALLHIMIMPMSSMRRVYGAPRHAIICAMMMFTLRPRHALLPREPPLMPLIEAYLFTPCRHAIRRHAMLLRGAQAAAPPPVMSVYACFII